MKKIFISFGTTHNYQNSIRRIKLQAENMNYFDEVIIFTEKDFDEEYLKQNGDFMTNNSRGYGYWCWKSYFIKKVMNTMNDNDILVYADCGCTLVNTNVAIGRLDAYVKLCSKLEVGNLSFQMVFPEKSYTKSDVFHKLNALDDTIMNSGQLVGGIFVLRKCPNVIKLIDEYYNACQDHSVIDNSQSETKNDPTFVDHRHDQSVFSILRKKHGTIRIPDETWYENFNSPIAMTKPILATRLRF